MTTSPSIRRNYAINALLTLVNLAYPFATLAYLARIIGPGYLGKYYIASSLVTYFLFAASFGIPLYGAREIARHRGDREALGKVFSELALLNLFTSLAATALFAFVAASVPEFRDDWRLFLILGIMLPLNIFSVDFLFLGLEDQAHIAARSLASKSLSLVCLFALVREAGDYLWYAAITTGGLFLHNLTALPSAFRRAGPRLRGLAAGRHLRPLALIFMTVLAANVYLNLDSVILGLLTEEKVVGWYNAALRLVRVAVALLTAIGITVIPRMTRFLDGGREDDIRALLGKSFDLLCLLAIPGCLVLGIAAPGIIALIFGPGFEAAVPVLRIAAPLVVLTGLTSYLGTQVLFPRGGEKAMLLSALAGAALSPALLLLLAPRYGPVGAAWSAVAAESAVLAVQWTWARVRYGMPAPIGPHTWKYLTAGAGFCAVLLAFRAWTPLAAPHLLSAVAVAGMAYLALLHFLKEPLLGELRSALSARLR